MNPILDAPIAPGQILAPPLHSAGRRARMTVAAGDVVRAGQTLAVSESGDGADVCAPAGGKILGVETRRLAAPVKTESECVILQVGEDAGADAAPPLRISEPRRLLKAAGILGLGGAAFPAWRKWRDGARFLIVNAAESDSAVSCDAALRSAMGRDFAKAAARVGKILDAQNIVIAVSDSGLDAEVNVKESRPGNKTATYSCRRYSGGAHNPDAIASAFFPQPSESGRTLERPNHARRRYSDGASGRGDSAEVIFFHVGAGDLAAGSERLLVRAIAGADIAPPQIPADLGIVCFNAATVAAMDEAFCGGVPMTRRIVTARENGATLNIRAPFGMELAGLAALAGMSPGFAKIGGRRARDACPADAVVCPATNAVDFAPSGAGKESAAAFPCVRCGACVPACPVGLDPMRLHFLNLDSRREELRAEKIVHCLECGRCDDACPSGIPLAREFGAARDFALAEERAMIRAGELRARHSRHLRTLRRKTAPRPASESAKSAALAAALSRAAQK